VAVIRIDFPKIGFTVSTWMDDDEWDELGKQGQNALIYSFIKNRYARQLRDAQQNPRKDANYRWEEV
jgi:hypothetical protein